MNFVCIVTLGLIKFNILFLNIKYDSDDFMILSKLFHSFTVYGKKEFLKSSVLTLKFGRGEKRVVQSSDGLEMRSFKC